MKVVALPNFLPPLHQAWMEHGLHLVRAARSSMFAVGDWWNNPPPGCDPDAIVRSEEWIKGGGMTPGSCRIAGNVARRFPAASRLSPLDFGHFQEVAALPDEQAVPLLREAADQKLSTSKLRARVKQARRDRREAALAQKIAEVSVELGVQHYGVIYADPPWRFEPYSRESGLDRAADNHYPTMTLEAIGALDVPAAADCVLFLWATAPMVLDAFDVMSTWGFEYRSHLIWKKDRAGTGYWARNMHEILLIGARGNVPAPAGGMQPPSVIEAAVGKHSEKPEAFADLIAKMFPTIPKLEMFARKPRAGWDSWGAEAEAAESDR